MTESIVVEPGSAAGRTRFPALPAAEIPGSSRVGGGFAALFGTSWLVQGALAAAVPAVAAVAVVAGLGLAVALWRTRPTPDRKPLPSPAAAARRARRWVTWATVGQVVASVPGGIVVALLDPTAVIPFVVLTVGLYLLALSPVVRRAHLPVAGAVLTVVPLATLVALEGPARTAVAGLVTGTVFLLKGVVDAVLAART